MSPGSQRLRVVAKKGQTSKRSELTARQAAFVRAYLKEPNATKAAIAAGYAESGAATEGYRLLRNAEISAAIGKKAARAEISVEEVLRGLKKEADGTQADSTGSSRVAAWGLLGKSLQMFVDRVDHEHTLTILLHDPYALPQKGEP